MLYSVLLLLYNNILIILLLYLKSKALLAFKAVREASKVIKASKMYSKFAPYS